MSGFSLLFPQIPFFGGVDDANGDARNIIQGAARDFFTAPAADTDITFSFGAENIPLLGSNGEPDYILLYGINDLCSKDGGTIDIDLDCGAIPYAFSSSFDSDDLAQGNIFYSDVVLESVSPIPYYNLMLSWSNSVQFKISKIFVGKRFQFGRNPTYRNSIRRIETDGVIRPMTSGVLEFQDVSATIAKNFYRYIYPYHNSMTFFLYDEDSATFYDKFTYCRIFSLDCSWRNSYSVDLRFEFAEIL